MPSSLSAPRMEKTEVNPDFVFAAAVAMIIAVVVIVIMELPLRQYIPGRATEEGRCVDDVAGNDAMLIVVKGPHGYRLGDQYH